ncbi:unnamed protein product, partial [Linum tenue]
IYRPIWAAFPNNPTHRQRLVVRQGPGTTGLSPSLAPLSKGLGPDPTLRTLLQTIIRVPWALDSQAGHFLVRSSLLRESCSQRRPQPTTSFSAKRKARVRPREDNIRSHLREGIGRRCVTPRKTCPQPDGFGRNLRSKSRWFTGFCNSHQVSHFATFFIDVRAEISFVESHYNNYLVDSHAKCTETGHEARHRSSIP